MSHDGKATDLPCCSVELTEDVAVHPTRRLWSIVTGRSAIEPLTAVAWVALIVLLLFRTVDIATNDFREHPIAGDQSAFLMQAQSLARAGHDLVFDEADFERFAALGWFQEPIGLFFQRYDDGWAFAKPYGYSLMAAPALVVFNDVQGMAMTNAFLLFALVVVALVVLRTRYTGPVVPLVAGSFYLLAQPYLYGYVLHSELFLALLSAVALGFVLWYWRSGNFGFAVLAFVVMAFAVTEKPPMLALFVPVAALVLVEQRGWGRRTALVAVGACVWAVAVVPYLVYSNGATWNPYSGDRYYAKSAVPFDGREDHEPGDWTRAQREEYFEIGVIEKAVSDPGARIEAALYYFVGRHTGLLVFLPTGLFLLVAALARARRLDRRAWVVLAGIFGYIAFYVLFFPNDYIGGASLGNRYFLQIAPSILFAVVLAKVSTRAAASAAIAGAVVGLVMLWPHHERPSGAYSEQLNQTTIFQRLLPFESSLDSNGYFKCPLPYTSRCVDDP